jgi:hypothetical protein
MIEGGGGRGGGGGGGPAIICTLVVGAWVVVSPVEESVTTNWNDGLRPVGIAAVWKVRARISDRRL